MNVLVAATVYTVLMYVMIEPRWKEAIFILTNPIPEEFTNQLEALNVRYYYSYASESENEKLKYDCFAEKLKLNKCVVYGNDHIYEARTFIFNTEFIVIDEGFLSFTDDEMLIHREMHSFTKEGKKYVALGWDESIKEIYTTRNHVSVHYQQKIKSYNLQKLWKYKNENEQNEIFFLFGENKKDFSKKIVNKKVCLVTQCFSEYGLMPEFNKIQMYKKILKKTLREYDKDQMLIKPHPAERTNYQKIFPECTVLNGNIPFQLIELLKTKFEKIVSINSSAIDSDNSSAAKYHYILQDYYIRAQQNLLNFITKNENKNIVCYGCGECGQATVEFLKRHNVKIDAFVISDDQKNELTNLNNIPIYKLSSLPYKKDVAIVICIINCPKKIISALEDKDFKNIYELEWNPGIDKSAYGVK